MEVLSVNSSKNSVSSLRKITVSAVFLALGVVMSLVTSFDIPVLGESGLKVGFGGIFTAFPAILFGPLYGGAVSGLADLFRTLIKPSGAFNPLFTITAFLGGALRGLIWVFIKEKSANVLKAVTSVISAGICAVGIVNIFLLKSDGITPAFFDSAAAGGDFSGYSLIGRLILSRAAITKNPGANLSAYITYVTTALILFGAIMLAVTVADYLITKFSRNKAYPEIGFKISFALVISGLIQTTLNTVILREMFYPSWKQLSFFIVLIPRAVEEVVVRVIQALAVALLYDIYIKQISHAKTKEDKQ